MKRLIPVIAISILAQTMLIFAYQYIAENLNEVIDPRVRFLLFFIFTSAIMVFCLYYIKHKSLVKLEYVRSFGILMLVFIPASLFSRLFLGSIRNNSGAINWNITISGLLTFILFGIFLALIVSIFFRKRA